jgi:hypothetical protein
MIRRKALHLIRDAVLASAVPNAAWAYLSWRYKLGVGPIYVWPWVLMVTLLYAYRADKFGLNSGGLGIVANDFRSIHVASLPFLAAISFPFLNFALNPKAPDKSLPIVLVVSGASWWVHDLYVTISRLHRDGSL